MPKKDILDIARKDLFTNEDELNKLYCPAQVNRLLRLRDMYLWQVANPDCKDTQFISIDTSRYKITRQAAYSDLRVICCLVPLLHSKNREFHLWRYNEMILETYAMAKARKDVKAMEKAASSYARNNKVDLDDEKALPYDMILVQPFIPTMDPTVLGIKPIPNLQEHINELLEHYRKESMDIEDIECEEVDLEEQIYFPELAKQELAKQNLSNQELSRQNLSNQPNEFFSEQDNEDG
jgi:hypothetical protein